MNIGMIVRATFYSSPGGDTTQIEMTARYLRRLGIVVDIKLTNDTLDYKKYDLLHFFNIIRPDDILPHINHDVPFVVSPILVDYSEYEKKNRQGILGKLFSILNPSQIEYLKAWARWIKNGDKIKSYYYLSNGHHKSLIRIAREARMLLPNSDSEYYRLKKEIGFEVPYLKIPNAIDHEIFQENVAEEIQFKDHVLCVGRIEGRKNQLMLIRALAGMEINLSIIGKPSPNHIAYYEECKRVASGYNNIHFIEQIDHSKLPGIYKASKVHVLASWFETTGLSSLEAAAMGCNIVVTKKGDTEEYFGEKAYYCEPDDVDSIRTAIVQAYTNTRMPGLRDFIFNHYTWSQAAQQTLKAYKIVLE
ncbi:MAG TPA: glycosyltransferase [Cytophagaceae bacterium]|jgi:glycosyltransferase involved in cell wall biosynthesis|nr:glycosyltransferase [Cytophagaceae bacterium]